jgi:hypothetical protein
VAKKTLLQAVNDVPSYIEPANCFVVYAGTAQGWAPLSGTPCAHYVSHALGIKSKASLGGYGCKDGYELRVRPLVSQMSQIPVDQVRVNDVWARLKGDVNTSTGDTEPTDHCGLVIGVAADPVKGQKITIRHDSSGQHKVAVNDWSFFGKGGQFYRAPSQAVIPPSVQANTLRAQRGMPLTPAELRCFK